MSKTVYVKPSVDVIELGTVYAALTNDAIASFYTQKGVSYTYDRSDLKTGPVAAEGTPDWLMRAASEAGMRAGDASGETGDRRKGL